MSTNIIKNAVKHIVLVTKHKWLVFKFCCKIGMHISPYEFGNINNKDPLRDKKLLLNKSEINKLIGKVQTKGYSLVPISIYFKGSLVKLELGIGKGKKLYDKRETIAKKDAERRMAIALKGNY